MNRTLRLGTTLVSGIFAVAVCALAQNYTISAKPGAINYIEGNVLLDGQPLTAASLKSTFLNAGGLLETQDGKAEVLLTPGVFLRVGDQSRVRMLKPSLIDTQIAIEAGESMVEVDQYIHASHLTVSMRGGLTEIEKNGLYRFMADGEASVAVIDGKAEVSFGEKHTGVGKGHEAVLSDALRTRDFDKNRDDDLYAWSNIRAQYDASLTYQAARSASNSSGYGYNDAANYPNYGGYGYGGGFYGQGWYWSNGFNSWLWMPGGEFFSPFGWGFYGPGYVRYAPVVVVPVVVAGGGVGTGKPILPFRPRPMIAGAGGMTVPVNPKQMPAIGTYARSPASFAAASAQSARAISASGGLRTYSGAPAARGFSGGGFGGAQSHAAASGGGSSGGHASGGSFSGGSGGMSAGSHASAGGASGGGGGGAKGK
jgi:hypothetical protein